MINDPVISAPDLSLDLATISKWAYQWEMEFNPDVNEQDIVLLISQKTNSPFHPPPLINGIEVTKVNEHKHLGLILDAKLSFAKHNNEKIKTAH